MALIDDLRLSLRITNDEYDDEIMDLADAAKADLVMAGLLEDKAEEITDPLVKMAITTYVKANFGWGNADGEKLQNAYESQKARMTLHIKYKYGEVRP